jgi:molybdopterin synthase catalytic subunit
MAHRTGRLQIGEVSVVVSVSMPAPAEAFEACRWGIDRLKESVPIWKKEHAADGTFWIEGRRGETAVDHKRCRQPCD